MPVTSLKVFIREHCQLANDATHQRDVRRMLNIIHLHTGPRDPHSYPLLVSCCTGNDRVFSEHFIFIS